MTKQRESTILSIAKLRLTLVGTNHKHSSVDVRERLWCQSESLPDRLRATIQGNGSIKEVVILSTCNRTEIYAVSSHEADVSSYLADCMSRWSQVRSGELRRHLYSLTNEEASRHLLALASGLDSMVVGEQQIQDQVRDAAKVACRSGASGEFLSGLFNHAYRDASIIRERSGVGLEGSSVSSAAVSLLKRASNTHQLSSVLLIGAGKMISLAAEELSSLPDIQVWTTNRTAQRAKALARRFGGRQIPFEQIPKALETVDAVLTCTSSPDYVITAENLKATLPRKRERSLVLVDAAVPRNIDPLVSKIPGIELYNIDDLVPFLSKDQQPSRQKVTDAEGLVSLYTEKFWARVRAQGVLDTLRELRRTAEGIRKDELSRALRRLSGLSDREKDIVDLLSRKIVSSLLYEPTERLKAHASNGDSELYEKIIRELFAIEQDHKPWVA